MYKEGLDCPITELEGVHAYHARLFAQKEVCFFKDLLYYFPKRYEDRSSILSLEDAYKHALENPASIATLLVTCTNYSRFYFRDREIPKFTFSDASGDCSLSAFNPAHRFFKVGETYFLTGKLKQAYNELQLNLLDYEIFDEEAVESLNLGRIVPLYSSTQGLSQKKIRNAVKALLCVLEEEAFPLSYEIPSEILAKYRLRDKLENVKDLHFPESQENLTLAKQELIFEEFFVFQLHLAVKKIKEKQGKSNNCYDKDLLKELVLSRLPLFSNRRTTRSA